MTNNPYDNNYDNNVNFDNNENISSSVNPEDTEHINASTPDYTPDEYYQKHYADQSYSADNYAKYGESYYNGNSAQQSQQESPRVSSNHSSYSPQPFPSYTSSYEAPKSNTSNYSQKKEKKPVTRGTVAAVV